MVKLVEFFHNSDLPEKILPPIDFDVAEDLVVFMRNDPVFYRKSLFPAVETVKSTDPMDTTALQNVVTQGLDKYCEKFQIPHPKTELLTDGDISSIVERLVAEEIKGEGDLNESQSLWDRIWNGPEDNFKKMQAAVVAMYARTRRNPKSDPAPYMTMLKKQFPDDKPFDMRRAIEKADI